MGTSQSRTVLPPNITEPDEKAHFAQSLSELRLSSPVSTDGSLSLDIISDWESALAADPKAELARTILAHSNIESALTKRSALVADAHVFNHEIDFKTGPVTDQKSSGRCWLFATTNVLRYEVMKHLKLKEFQLSQVRLTVVLLLF